MHIFCDLMLKLVFDKDGEPFYFQPLALYVDGKKYEWFMTMDQICGKMDN